HGAHSSRPACKPLPYPSQTPMLSTAYKRSEFLNNRRMGQSLQDRKVSLPRRFMRTLLLCAALYLVACLGCVSFQRRLIYFPTVCTAEKADEFAKSERLERWQ